MDMMDKVAIAEKNTLDRICKMGGFLMLARVNHLYSTGTLRVVYSEKRRVPIVSGDNLEVQLRVALNLLGNMVNRDNELVNFVQQSLIIYQEELQWAEFSLQAKSIGYENLPVVPARSTVPVPVAMPGNAIVSENQCSPIMMVKDTQEDSKTDSEAKPEKPNPSVIAKEVVCKYNFAIYQEGIYLFVTGRYNLVTEIAIKRLLNEEYRNEAECYGFAKFYDQIIDFVYCEKNLVIDSQAFDRTTYLIAFKNGYLDTRTLKFYAPDHSLFFTANVNFDFSGFNQDCPNFDNFLHQIAGGDELLIERIYQIMGLTLSNDLNAKAIFCFQGVTNSAKSTLITFLASFFNEDLITAISVGDLERNFAISELIGKAFCSDTELTAAPIKTAAVAKLKQLSSKDLLSSDVKYRARVKFVNRAKIFLATNHLLQLENRDDAFMKRLVAIPFYYEIPKAQCNPEVLRLFTNERLAIVNKAIFHYCKLRENNYIFSGDFQVNEMFMPEPSPKSKLVILTERDDLVKVFLNKCCELTAFDEFETTTNIHQAYKKFCSMHNALPVDQKKLTVLLKSVLGDKVEPKKRRINSSENPVSILYGIKLIHDEVPKEAGC